MGSIMFRERTHLAPPESQFAPQTDGLDARLRIRNIYSCLEPGFSFPIPKDNHLNLLSP